MNFLLLKTIHVSSATISITLFILRGLWSLNGSAIMRQRWIKTVPHFVDTVLLVSALGLAYTIEQYPFVDSWLTAKFFALVLHIILGSVAIKYGKTRTIRISAFFGALAVFAYIVMVAMTHDPLLFIH
jgi:uncharacterized membrane protein SirB2